MHHGFLAQFLAAQLASQLPLVHDQNAIAHAEDFFQIAGNHQNGDAFGGEVVHQRVDFAARADIHAASRFVKDHDARLAGQPLGEDDLLLIAAGQQADDLPGS